jgi:hypothetical protein
MPKRIDLGGDDSEGGLEEALRQLQRPRRQPEAEQPQQQLQEAVREIAEQQKVAPRRGPSRAPAWLKWVVLAVIVIGAIVAAVVFARPEPLPPPATSAKDAVVGFWKSVIAGNYQAATVYCPDLIRKYGSRRQAANWLSEQFSSNPPVRLGRVGEPEQLPDSTDTRVSYQVYLRSGTPRTGDAIVSDTGDRKTGYVITAGL